MTFKGFGKQFLRKPTTKVSKIPDISTQKAIEFSNLIKSTYEKSAKSYRTKAEKEYGSYFLEAHSLIFLALTDLLNHKAGIPGKTNDSISERLILITNFVQGLLYTEKLISEGQHIKASAALKQDIEILTRIYEINKGVSKEGKTPNVTYAPGNLRQHYGDMNNIAHISKIYVMQNMCTTLVSKEINGASIFPVFHEQITKKFYELHINICYILAMQALKLFEEMYSDDDELLLPAFKLLVAAKNLLEKAGWVFLIDTTETV